MKETPAIVRPSADLKSLASEINTAYKLGTETSKKSIEQFRQAGLALLKVKEIIGYGKLTDWIGANADFTDRHGRRYMKLAEFPADADLESKWKIICGRHDDEDIDEPSKKTDTVSVLDRETPTHIENTKQCRTCRTSGARKNCKDCKAMNPTPDKAKPLTVPPPAEPDEPPEFVPPPEPDPVVDDAGNEVPESLMAVFMEREQWKEAQSVGSKAAKLFKAIEDGETQRRLDRVFAHLNRDRTDDKMPDASQVMNLAVRRVKREAASVVCSECKGIDASDDAELCKLCDGKGFLSKGEMK